MPRRWENLSMQNLRIVPDKLLETLYVAGTIYLSIKLLSLLHVTSHLVMSCMEGRHLD
jgi:hypothetical protein